MKIRSVESIVVRIPVRHKGKLGVGSLDIVENVLVFLKTDEGLVGYGEASPWPVFAETPWGTKDAIDRYLGPCVLNEDPINVEKLLMKMDTVLVGYPFAKAGIETALLDLTGKILNQPLYKILGGLVRDRISVSYSVANQDTDKDVKEVEWLLERGIRKFKMKTGVLPLVKEVERLNAVSKILPPDAQFRFDFNQGLTWENAMVTCRRLEAFRPLYMEQPLRMWNIEGMALIAQALDTPISADESVFSIYDCLRVVKARAADIISIKIMKHGGILKAKKIAAIAEAAGLPCYAGAMWESGIGIAASMHCTASTPNIIYGSDYYIPNFLLNDDMIQTPLKVENGFMFVPKGTGLGVEIDMDAVNRYRVD